MCTTSLTLAPLPTPTVLWQGRPALAAAAPRVELRPGTWTVAAGPWTEVRRGTSLAATYLLPGAGTLHLALQPLPPDGLQVKVAVQLARPGPVTRIVVPWVLAPRLARGGILALPGYGAYEEDRLLFLATLRQPAEGAPYALLLCPAATLIAGGVDARGFRPVTRWVPRPGAIPRLEMTSGDFLPGETPASLTGRRVRGEVFALFLSRDPESAPLRYAALLRENARLRPAVTPVLGWSSWGAFLSRVDQSRVQREAALLHRLLASRGFRYLQVDDGWEQAAGDWRPGPTFPGGLPRLGRLCRAHGLTLALWWAPFRVAPRSALARAHPDWLLRDSSGQPVRAAGAYVLDATVPQARRWLLDTARYLRRAGVGYVKLDFVYLGTLAGRRHAPVPALVSYRQTMAALRRVLVAPPGPPVLVLGSGAPLLPGGWADALRISRDIEDYRLGGSPSPDSVHNLARAAVTRWFWHGRLVNADPDDAVLVGHGPSLSTPLARALLTLDVLSGGVLQAGDPLEHLGSRLSWLQDPDVLAAAALPLSRAPSVPFSTPRAGGPLPLLLRKERPETGEQAVAAFRWQGGSQLVRVPLPARLAVPVSVREVWGHALGWQAGGLVLRLRGPDTALVVLRAARPLSRCPLGQERAARASKPPPATSRWEGPGGHP